MPERNRKMGHWCRICDRNRANEKFSAKGHKNHICRDCAKKPKEEIELIDQEQEIFRYLNQSNISAKNLSRLEQLAKSQSQRIAELAAIVLEVVRTYASITSMNAYYQTIASEYARQRRVHPEVLRCLISTGKLGSASSLLEVGCGTGNYLVALDEVIGCDCWGVDPSEAMLVEARKRSTKAKLFCVRAEHMGLPADQFDRVFAVDVVHHIVDRSRAFRECRRALRAGGRVCLVTESPSMIHRREPHATYFPEAVPIELARSPSLLTLSTEMHEA